MWETKTLGELHDKGLEGDVFVHRQVWRSHGDDIQHGDEECSDLTTPAQVHTETVDPARRICEHCWLTGIASGEHRIALHVQLLEEAERLLSSAKKQGVLGDGLPALLLALESTRTELPATSRWAGRVRTEAVRAVLAAHAAVPSTGRPETIARIPAHTLPSALQRASSRIRELVGAHLHTISSDMLILRGPRKDLEDVQGTLTALLHSRNRVELAQLEEGDTETIIETALKLYDPDSEELSKLERCFRAARAV